MDAGAGAADEAGEAGAAPDDESEEALGEESEGVSEASEPLTGYRMTDLPTNSLACVLDYWSAHLLAY